VAEEKKTDHRQSGQVLVTDTSKLAASGHERAQYDGGQGQSEDPDGVWIGRDHLDDGGNAGEQQDGDERLDRSADHVRSIDTASWRRVTPFVTSGAAFDVCRHRRVDAGHCLLEGHHGNA